MNKILIRPAKKADFEEMIAIVKTLPSYFVPEYVKDVEGDIRSEKSLLAVSGGKISGFLNYKVHTPQKAEILWMAVDPTSRSQGIGSRLMNEFLKKMKKEGIKKVKVLTIASTDPSRGFAKTRRFYEKHGFKEVKVEKNYYEPGDRGTMEKRL